MKLRAFIWIISLLIITVFPTCLYAQLRGGNWEVIANGFRGTLNISVDPQGNVTGTIFGDSIEGFFDQVSNKIIFVRTFGDDPLDIQVYTGYLWTTGATFCTGGDIRNQMAGSFEAFASSGATPGRNVFGWTAILCLIL